MVQNTDTHMGTHTHMGEARVLAHTRIWATHTRTGIPYAYGLPVRVWAAHMHMGQPMHTRMGRIPVWDGTLPLYNKKTVC